MSKNVGKKISKTVSSKYNQKKLDHGKKSAADALKTTSKRAIQKAAEAYGNLIGNETVDKITGVSKNSPQNNSQTNEEGGRFISPEKRQKIIDDLRHNYII